MPKLSFLSERSFDTGLAALAALSAGFVAFAMPEPLFTGLVETSRLPQFVDAARPPLGETARIAAAGAAALAVFAAVWAVMAALGRLPAPRLAEAEPEAEAPRLRRADAHPDAPARRPLLARDLGEPLDLDGFPEAPAEDLAEAEAEAPRPLPAFLVPQEPEAESVPDEARRIHAEAPFEAVDAEPVDSQPEIEAGPAFDAEVAAAPLSPPLSELAGQLPESEDQDDQSLSQLVNRIEFGLQRKRQALPALDLSAAGAEEAEEEPEKVGHRLRSAINDLQKIASSGG